MHQLPKTLDLLKTSWTQYKQHWNDLMRVSIWMLWIAAIQSVGTAIFLFNKNSQSPLLLLVFIPIIPLAILVGTRITLAGLNIGKNEPVDSDSELWKQACRAFLPIVWLSVLQSLCILGATLLFVIPAIYLSIGFMFASMILLDQGTRGTHALSAGLDLVRGRWWATFWRAFAGIFLIMVPTMIASAILFGILGGISGVDAINAGHPLVESAQALFQGAIQTLVIPLVVLFQVNLYQALRKT